MNKEIVEELTSQLEDLIRLDKQLKDCCSKFWKKLNQHDDPLRLLHSMQRDISQRQFDCQMFELPIELQIFSQFATLKQE